MSTCLWLILLLNHAQCVSSGAGNIADIDKDGTVNLQDMARFSALFKIEQNFVAEDMDRNGYVDLSDMMFLCNNWLWSRTSP